MNATRLRQPTSDRLERTKRLNNHRSEELLPNVVEDMTNIFEDGLIDGTVDGETLKELSDTFQTVPLPLRAAVYKSFVENLQSRGHAIDFTYFKGNA